MSSRSKTVIKLTQEQSKILDNLPWGPLKVKEKQGQYGPYTVKFSLCSFDNAPIEASKIFAELNVGQFETLRSYSGLYDYSKGDDVFFQKPVKGTSSWTQEQKDQRKEDLAGLEGNSNSEFQKKRQDYWEQREKTIDERWKETKLWQDRVLQLLTEQTQVIQEFLFKMNTKELGQSSH